MKKSDFKELVATKITAFHELELRGMANNISLIKYLNTSLSSLRGRKHPSLSNIITSQDVRKCRPYL